MYKKMLVSLTVPVFAAAMALAQNTSPSSSPSSSSTPDQSSAPSAQSSTPNASPSSPSSASPSDQSTSPSANSSQSSPSSTPDQASPSSQTSQTTTSSTTTSTTASNSSGKEKSIRGCIVKQGSDFYLQNAKGDHKLIKLNSTEDLSAHVGHEVKVRGTESAASASASTSGSSQTASNSSASGSASGMPQSDVNGANVSDKELTVSKIDMVSDTCPIKSSNTSGMSNNPSTPPQQH